jgi:hypothetical protein
MNIRRILIRGLSLVAAGAICAELALKLGPWRAMALWAIGVAVVGGVVAFLMHRQSPPEKVSWINYLAGAVLPWGYRIGRGKLWPIVVTSWAIWMLLGVAVIMATARTATTAAHADSEVAAATMPAKRASVVMTLLCLAWLVDGGALLRCIGLVATSANPRHMMRSLAVPMLVLAGILVASIALVVANSTAIAAQLALLIAGGPPLLVGGGYGIFVLVMLTAGRNARWN